MNKDLQIYNQGVLQSLIIDIQYVLEKNLVSIVSATYNIRQSVFMFRNFV